MSDKFDQGLATVDIVSTGQQVLLDGLIIRRIIVDITVTELNGETLDETEKVQQLIEIMPDGSVQHARPCHPKSDLARAQRARGRVVPAVLTKAVHWLVKQPYWIRALVYICFWAVFGVSIYLVGLAVLLTLEYFGIINAEVSETQKDEKQLLLQKETETLWVAPPQYQKVASNEESA